MRRVKFLNIQIEEDYRYYYIQILQQRTRRSIFPFRISEVGILKANRPNVLFRQGTYGDITNFNIRGKYRKHYNNIIMVDKRLEYNVEDKISKIIALVKVFNEKINEK